MAIDLDPIKVLVTRCALSRPFRTDDRNPVTRVSECASLSPHSSVNRDRQVLDDNANRQFLLFCHLLDLILLSSRHRLKLKPEALLVVLTIAEKGTPITAR